MRMVLWILIDILPIFVILMPLLILWQHFYCKIDKPAKDFLLTLLTGYLLAVFQITGIPSIGSFQPEINLILIPFTELNIYATQSILNVFLFIPLGFFLPLLWGDLKKFRFTLLTGFGLSLTIEVLQLFTFRVTDVNDLITNTLGTVIGYLLARLFLLLFHISPSEGQKGKGIKQMVFVIGSTLLFWICTATPLMRLFNSLIRLVSSMVTNFL